MLMRRLILATSAVLAGATLAGSATAQEYNAPQIAASEAAQEWVDLSYLLIAGLGTPNHLPMFFNSAGVYPVGKVPSPMEAERALGTVHGKVFDNLYFAGSAVGTWLLKTSDGLIMFDAMNNSQDSEKIIEPRMRQMGLDPAQIKYIIIMHSHGDHYGGVKYFQDKYKNIRVLAGPRDWDNMEALPAVNAQGRAVVPPPRRDMSVQDGQTLTLGDTSVRLFLTSGHTKDTVSALVPVTHNGQKHLMAFWGGTGAPRTIEPPPAGVWNNGLRSYRDQLLRFTKLGIEAGADGVISNHSVVDAALHKVPLIAGLKPGQPHPFVLGKDGYLRWMGAFVAAVNAGMTVKRDNPSGAVERE